MTIRIAILAACAGTLALAQPDMARANTRGASESKSAARVTEIAPGSVIVVAQNQGGTQVQEIVVTGSRAAKQPKAGKKAGTGNKKSGKTVESLRKTKTGNGNGPAETEFHGEPRNIGITHGARF